MYIKRKSGEQNIARIGCRRHLGVNLVVSVLCAVALTCLGGLFVPSNARADGYYNVDDHGVTYNVYDNDNGVARLWILRIPRLIPRSQCLRR